MMADWTGIKHALNSTLGTSGFSSLDNQITAAKNAIMADGGVKIVKSVQRGTAQMSRNNDDEITITISTVTPSKCIVLLNGHTMTGTVYKPDSGSGNVGPLGSPALSAFNGTQITISNNGGSYYGTSGLSNGFPSFSWQVIEFY